MSSEQGEETLAPVWSNALATIVLKRVMKTIDDTLAPHIERGIVWSSQERDTESLAKLIHLKVEVHYSAQLASLRERLVAAEALLEHASRPIYRWDYTTLPDGCSGSWELDIQRQPNGKWRCERRRYDSLGFATTRGVERLAEVDDEFQAYAAAKAAGWLQPTTEAQRQAELHSEGD